MSQSGEMADGCLPDLSPEEIYESKIDIIINKDPKRFIRVLVDIIEKSNSNKFDLIKKYLKFLRNEFLQQSNYDVNKLSRMASEVWKDPCFVDCVRLCIKEYKYVTRETVNSSNNDLAADRAKHMVADPCFKHSLLRTIYDTTNTTLIRVFLCILFGHWAGEAEFRELDERMGENHFGKIMDKSTGYEALNIIMEKDVEYDEFSYIMKSAYDVENMEPLREELVNKYGRICDVQTVLDEVKTDIMAFVNFTERYFGYASINVSTSKTGVIGGVFIFWNTQSVNLDD